MGRSTLAAVLGAIVVGVVAWAALGAGGSESSHLAGKPTIVRPGAAPHQLERLPPDGRVLVRVADPLTPRLDGPVYELSARDGARRAGTLRCKQVHAIAGGPGLCLALVDNGSRYQGILFDERYRPYGRFPIEGVPDRARVSPDGRYGAYTTFNSGSSRGYFASVRAFSTNTRIVDMRTGKQVLHLHEGAAVTRNGRPFKPASSEFWGVTFGRGGRFYATMAADVSHYLLKGDVGTKRMRVVAGHVECPSLSPDGRRIAYKRRLRFTTRWRLHVLDLRTGKDTRLAEARSIDDQPEWLDNQRITYSDDRSVFVVPADGKGRVERIAAHASSPASLIARD